MDLVLIAIACGVVALLYGILTSQQVLRASPGNQRMQEVAGAMAMMGVADTYFHRADGFAIAAEQPLITISPRPGWVSHGQSKRRRIHYGWKRLALL